MEYPMPSSSFPQTHSEIERKNQRSSAASSHADPMVYDVFINHRGPDTKEKFAIHLYRRLLSNGLRGFLDQKELQKGFDFPPQIANAIQTASVHVAIFSPRYAESSWCLRELALMVESGAPIIPVFYDVEPAELRWIDQNKNGVYAKALHELEMKRTYDSETRQNVPRYDSAIIKKWRNALSTVAEKSGFDLKGMYKGDEIQMLDEVVADVVKLAKRVKVSKKTRLHVARYPTGLDEKVKDFETAVLKQQQHSGKVQVVGIVGLGGVGKTTLVQELFNRKSSNFKQSCILIDVGENARSGSLHSLQSNVMTGLTRGLTQSELNIENIYEGIAKLKKHLQSSHVLLVLDGVDHGDQLEAFLPVKDVLSSDSLILITSRHRDVFGVSGVEESSIYQLTGLSRQHSLELFCSYAFLQAYPPQGFEDLVGQFVMACDGLPLSLRVFGGLLFGKDNQWYWEHILDQVHKVPDDILKRLKISYDALPEDEKQIFLDIACFLIGEKKNTATRVWNESGREGLFLYRNLESKCLVEVDSDNSIHMHAHLRDLGRQIARDKLPRRLCWTENIDNFLQQLSVNTEVRGIRMLAKTDTDSNDETSRGYQRWSHELFESCVTKLRNRLHNTGNRFLGIGVMKLQLVQTEGHLLERILRRVHSANLTWLSWRDCPYSYLPSWVPMKNLRVLKVEGKVFKTLWQGRSQAPFQLRELEISGTLLNISKSIGQLKYLERIVFDYVDLQKVPDEFYDVKSLKALVLRRCSKLKELPESFGRLMGLQHIKLSECWSLETLPESFGNLRNLQNIELSGCRSLKSLPDSFVTLGKLQQFELSECWKLEKLPDSFGNLSNLQHLNLSECRSLEGLPESFRYLTNLQNIELSGCQRLETLLDSFGNLSNLQHIELSGCWRLKTLPDSFVDLMNLQHIELSGCESLETLPDSFDKLRNLQHIELSGCERLETLPDSFGDLRNLQHIKLSKSRKLETLPNSFGKLRNLQHLDLSECVNLKRLPDLFVNLTNLQYIDLSACRSLERLPNSFGNLNNLQHINLYGCENLQRLPDSFGENVQHIDLSHCKSLQELQELRSIKTLVSLGALKASYCVNC